MGLYLHMRTAAASKMSAARQAEARDRRLREQPFCAILDRERARAQAAIQVGILCNVITAAFYEPLLASALHARRLLHLAASRK